VFSDIWFGNRDQRPVRWTADSQSICRAGFCDIDDFVAVRKSFLVCFQEVAKFLNPEVLRLENARVVIAEGYAANDRAPMRPVRQEVAQTPSNRKYFLVCCERVRPISIDLALAIRKQQPRKVNGE
jgi:hypothetical protein